MFNQTLSNLAAIVTIMSGIIYIIRKRKNLWMEIQKKRNTIHIFITGNYEKPFSINSQKSTTIDFIDWYNKIKKGGEILVKCECVNEMEKYINNENIDEKIYAEIQNTIKVFNRHEEKIKKIIMIALLDKTISSKINCFEDFIKIIITKYFSRNITEGTKLQAYDNKGNFFGFRISDEEYANILEKSGGKIKIRQLMNFGNFIDILKDKSILEYEIIPNYLIYIVKKGDYNKINVEDLSNWWVSVA